MPRSDSYDAALNSLQEISSNFARAMDKATQKFKTNRNSVVPINSLPMEILCSIFAAVGDNARDKLHITGTCNLWRTIALNYPFMWTSIDLSTLSSLSMISTVLSRGMGHPLRIKCHDLNDLLLRSVMSELPRIQELDMTLTRASYDGFFLTKAPTLKRLSVSNLNPHSPYRITYHSDLPILEQLSLVDCQMSFTSVNLGNLRELYIHSSSDCLLPRVLIHGDRNIVSLLGDCPNLECLSLQGPCLQSYPLVHRAPPTILVKSSHLKSMRLSLSPDDIHCILSGIAAPTLRQCIIETRSLRVHDHHEPFLTGSFLSLDLLAITETLVVDEHTSLLCAYNTRTKSSFVCSVNIFLHPRVQHTMVAALARHYPMPQLHTIRLRHPVISDIIVLLRSFYSVQTLELVYMTHRSSPLGNTNVVHQLLLQAKDKDHPLVCTNLHTLSLERVYLSVHSVDALSELAVLWPNLRQLNLTWCKGDLPMDEIAEHLGAVSLSVECSNKPIALYDGVDVDMQAFSPLTI